ncbi:hypothetical protein [Streptomyces avidinii]|uniref:Uncharacterized protein n=1 Tax=Streptomyces avidinii TaxID=1895 RepID=A0ABS4L4G9_STRAV|nr:hypothetical protein [Streptomyces avidinii]MBP2036992.1 hypothetical protein [Streptomyces avidinii]GGY94462.1 hypothetical protein GCM10010343_19680 [Streptomyces avidinii]
MEGAGAALGELAHLQLGVAQALQYGLGVRQQGFAELGQRGAARSALDESPFLDDPMAVTLRG